ncbi:unnamed protein product, partial [Ectocarpus sp. 4 AP-2014]
ELWRRWLHRRGDGQRVGSVGGLLRDEITDFPGGSLRKPRHGPGAGRNRLHHGCHCSICGLRDRESGQPTYRRRALTQQDGFFAAGARDLDGQQHLFPRDRGSDGCLRANEHDRKVRQHD